MTTLNIDLQDGFRDHTVIIRVNGKEVYRKSGVSTDLRISRADAVEVQVGSGKSLVEIAVDPGGVHKSIEIDANATPHLAVNREKDGQLTVVTQRDAFRYM